MFEKLVIKSGLLVSHSFDQTTPVEFAIVTAFLKLGENVEESEETLFDFVDPDALNSLVSDSDAPTTISVQLWGYPVLIDSDRIRIFEKTNS